MRTRFAIAVALVVVAVAGTSRVSAGMQQTDQVAAGRIHVQFHAGVMPQAGGAKTGLAGFDRIAERFGIEDIRQAFPSIEAAAAKRQLSPTAQALRRVYEVQFSAPHEPRFVADELARDADVEHAEPIVLYRPDWDGMLDAEALATPDDTHFSRQTHLDRLRMTDAWDVAKGEDGSIVIAVVDGGTDWRHPDLRDNVWTNPGEIPGNGVDDDANGYVDDVRGWNFANGSADPTGLTNTSDLAAHGTMVAGIAAAVTNNALGIAGTGWNARFMAINIGCKDGGLICHSIDGVAYAALNGADVITASWGSSVGSSFMKAVMKMALEEGALVVAGSGNDRLNVDRQPHYPSSYNSTLSVGGTRKDSDQNEFNYGRSVNVYAPARQIDGTWPGSGYRTKSGTSLAVPLVAGVAAIVKTAFPNFSPQRLREQIRLTSDGIEDVNSGNLAGLLGRGRVNAYRAVTEDAPAGIRLVEWKAENEDGTSDLRSSQVVRITATFTNYGGDGDNVTVGFESPSPFLEFEHESETVGALAYGASHTATFEFRLADNAPDNYQAVVYSTVSHGAFEDSPDVIRLSVSKAGVATHNTEALVVSITDKGNIGYRRFRGDSQGRGFQVRDRNGRMRDLLFEGGLLVGTGPETVSDCLRAASMGPFIHQHADFILRPGTNLLVETPGQLATQYGRVELLDTGARNPLDVSILQETFVDSAPENEYFMVAKYTVTNTSPDSLTDVHVGLFFDWDVHEANAQLDVARFDAGRTVGYIQDGADPTALAGVKVLTKNTGVSYEAINNPQTIYPGPQDGGFTEEEKWTFLSQGIGTTQLAPTDASQLMGAGPFSLAPMQSAIVAFAIIGGSSEANLLQSADSAQRLWDTVLNVERTRVEPGPASPTAFAFTPIYPNPGASPQVLEFRVPAASDVRLVIYNMLGQRVRTLASGSRAAGTHRVLWDGEDEAGQRVASGVYMARVAAQASDRLFQAAQPFVVLR